MEWTGDYRDLDIKILYLNYNSWNQQYPPRPYTFKAGLPTLKAFNVNQWDIVQFKLKNPVFQSENTYANFNVTCTHTQICKAPNVQLKIELDVLTNIRWIHAFSSINIFKLDRPPFCHTPSNFQYKGRIFRVDLTFLTDLPKCECPVFFHMTAQNEGIEENCLFVFRASPSRLEDVSTNINVTKTDFEVEGIITH